MLFNQDKRELPAMTGVVLEASLAPWGGRRICTDAYETSIRVTADLQLTRGEGRPPRAHPLVRGRLRQR